MWKERALDLRFVPQFCYAEECWCETLKLRKSHLCRMPLENKAPKIEMNRIEIMCSVFFLKGHRARLNHEAVKCKLMEVSWPSGYSGCSLWSDRYAGWCTGLSMLSTLLLKPSQTPPYPGKISWDWQLIVGPSNCPVVFVEVKRFRFM